METMTQKSHPKHDIDKDMRYLSLLSQSFPSVATASTEIINLEAILNLSLIHISEPTRPY